MTEKNSEIDRDEAHRMNQDIDLMKELRQVLNKFTQNEELKIYLEGEFLEQEESIIKKGEALSDYAKHEIRYDIIKILLDEQRSDMVFTQNLEKE